MNKSSSKGFIIVLFICISILFGAIEGFADNIAPEVQTQINKRTDLFQKSINDLPSLEQSLEDKKQATINAMGDGKTNTPQGLPSITKQSKSELENQSNKLESIHENDLNGRGREEMIKKNSINELYPDYSRPLNKQYMKDAKALADGQDKLMGNLFAKLKEIGVDCKTIKGDKKHEPEYFLKIKTTEHKDTIYNQTFCEELRNKYHCNDEVTLKCSKTGLRYGEWQYKTIRLPGHALHNEKGNWGYAMKWKYKRWGWHITPYHPKGWGEYQIDSPWRNDPAAIIADARLYLANKLGVELEQIREDVGFPPGGRGVDDGSSITPVGCRWRVAWNEYEFTYHYRDAYQVCEVWSEDWNERCRLQ